MEIEIIEHDCGCCESCNTDDHDCDGVFVPDFGRDVWLCPTCAADLIGRDDGC